MENFGYIKDPTITITATDEIINYTSSKKKLLEKGDLKKIIDDIYQNFDKKLKGDELDAALQEMMDKNEKFDKGDFLSVTDMLEKSIINLPENEKIERNPILAARVEKLKLEQNERDYQAMTKSISPGKFHKEDTVAYQMDMMNRQLIAVGQVILSVAAGFAFGFLGIPLIIGGMEFGMRVLLGLLAAGIIAIAELYFLAKYMHAEDTSTDERAKKD